MGCNRIKFYWVHRYSLEPIQEFLTDTFGWSLFYDLDGDARVLRVLPFE